VENELKNKQYYKFSFYGFFKNLRFFESFLILYFLSKDQSFINIGFLYSIKELTIFIMEIPSGVIADAVGRRRTLIFSFAFYIISFLVFYLAGSFLWFSVAMLFFALAEAFRSGVHKAMIFDYLQQKGWADKKTEYYGHTRSWSQKGSALSALTAAFLVFFTKRYDVVFLVSVVPYFIDMALIFSYPKWLDGELKRVDTVTVRQKFLEVEKAFAQTFRSLKFIRVLFSLSLYTGYYKAVKDYVQPMIRTLALTLPVFMYWHEDQRVAVFVGLFYFITYWLTSWMSRRSGVFLKRFADYKRPMNYTLVTGFMFGILAGGVYLLGWYFASVMGFVGIMLIENLRKPIGVAAVADLTNSHAMATVLSVSSQLQSVFAAIIAPMIGFIADQYGPGAGLAIVSIVLILLFPFYWLQPETK